MELTSFGFLFFLILDLLAYYVMSDSRKWIFLLFASILFICLFNVYGVFVILLLAFISWCSGLVLDKCNTDCKYNTRHKKIRKILLLSLFFIVGNLVLLKYVGSYISVITDSKSNPFSILIPIGLSYITLQAISYVMDVYWGRIKAEKSYFKILLYLSYFPQMVQGPISRYGELSVELFDKPHDFDIKNIKFGFELIAYGFFKVLVIGNRMASAVSDFFYSDHVVYGFTVFVGFVFFGIELYCNFSGGIDIIRGASECLGINLPINFRQPFLSKSLGDFWRRWHITLGAWMKDYIFFPLSMSKLMGKFKKSLKGKMSRRTINRIVIAICNIFVFLLVGIWHGTGTNYALWGLYNGMILAFSELMTDVYLKSKNVLHIKEESHLYKLFCIIRTFFIVTLGWSTDCATTASGSFSLLGNMLLINKTSFSFFDFSLGFILSLLCFVGVCFVSIVNEKGISVREWLDKRSFAFQVLFWIAFIQLIAMLGRTTGGGFLYAEF